MKDKFPVPNYCTSLFCGNFPCSYCKDCYHAAFKGRSRVNGVMYRWVYEPYYGVTFLTKDGDPLTTDETPGTKHPVWERFDKWWKRRGLT